MKTKNDKLVRRWSLGVLLIALATLLLIYPNPDEVTLQCEHAVNECTVKKAILFKEYTETFKINDIQSVTYDPTGYLARGYPGPKIKLKNGHSVYFQAGIGTTFPSTEKTFVEKVERYIEQPTDNKLSIKMDSLHVIYIVVGLYFWGCFEIFNSLKPYIIHGYKKRK